MNPRRTPATATELRRYLVERGELHLHFQHRAKRNDRWTLSLRRTKLCDTERCLYEKF